MGTASVITIPLKTEKWQEDVLYKRMEACRNVYNSMLSERMIAYKKMTSSEEYTNCIETIYSAYKANDEKEKKQIKKSAEYKVALEKRKKILIDNGFSSFSFKSISCIHADHFKDVLPTNVTAHTVGVPMWRAFEKMIFGNGKAVHYKKPGEIKMLETNGISGMRLVGENSVRATNLTYGQNYYLLYKSKNGKTLKLPLMIDKKDTYLHEMMSLENRVVRVMRKRVGNRDRYLLQLTIMSEPAIKYDANGNELHPVGDKKLGIYIDTVSITIFDGSDTTVLDLGMDITTREEESSLRSYMNSSRRIGNAENYNGDGTIKKGIIKNGIKMPLTWHYSKGYYKAKDHLANIKRIQAEQRKIRAGVLTNLIIEMGHDIHINDYPFEAAKMRKVFPEGEELTKEGKNKSKRKAGKAVTENAPAMIVTILDGKLKARGYDGIVKHKLKDVDMHMKDYRAIYAKELFDK